jgi:hypothetical protein
MSSSSKLADTLRLLAVNAAIVLEVTGEQE